MNKCTPLWLPTRPSKKSLQTFIHSSIHPSMAQQQVVLKILTMTDEKTKQKAIHAAADILGVDSIAVDLSSQMLTVVGEMDPVAVVKRLKKVGKVDLVFVGPVKKENKEDKKPEENK